MERRHLYMVQHRRPTAHLAMWDFIRMLVACRLAMSARLGRTLMLCNRRRAGRVHLDHLRRLVVQVSVLCVRLVLL